MKFSTVFVAVAAVQSFDVKPTHNGRRDFLTKIVPAAAGVAFFGGAANAAGVPFENTCDKERFEIASIATCHGDSKELTPTQEAYADSLLDKIQESQQVKNKQKTTQLDDVDGKPMFN